MSSFLDAGYYLWLSRTKFLLVAGSPSVKILVHTRHTATCKNFFQARTGFEPMTSAIPVQRSTN